MCVCWVVFVFRVWNIFFCRRTLDWYDTPDYLWMKSKVDEAMFERNYAMDYVFDWGNRVREDPPKKRFGLF